MLSAPRELRDQLLATCSGADMPREAIQALVDTLMYSIIVQAPTADDAERDMTNIAELMSNRIRASYAELMEARTRQ